MSNNSNLSSTKSKQHETHKEDVPLATVLEVFSFVGSCRTTAYLLLGTLNAIVAGFARPASLLYFSSGIGKISAIQEEGLGPVIEVIYAMMVIGVVSLISETLEVAFFETAANDMTLNLKRKWFEAVVRQDMSYFDIRDVSGIATTISVHGAKYKMALAYKLGRGIRFSCVVLVGFGIAFYSNWKVSLAVCTTVPIMAGATGLVLKLNQSKSSRDNASYSDAGKVVYQVASNIRAVLALNGAGEMIDRFTTATEKACRSNIAQLPYLGLAYGALTASFKLAHMIIIGYGTLLLYEEVREYGCDPSGAISSNHTCETTGKDIFMAFLGIIFASGSIPQITTAIEAFAGAQAACFPALLVMSRRSPSGDDQWDKAITKQHEALECRAHEEDPLPHYVIDIFSPLGKSPTSITGTIEFHNVAFAYPTRCEMPVLNGFNLKIEAGKTVALVGGSGSGKSTAIQLIERYYDPLFGKITLDGVDLRELNVRWLRQHIGLVSQEPTLFATTIRDNIKIAKSDATDKEIEFAARQANAHDFIMSLQKGYDTLVGDQGAQLSGGQKQRIAIARVLLTNPKIILLDEATSALDSESEGIVQEALDVIMSKGNVTVVVVAHRLSTVKNADMIAFVDQGVVVEVGTHEELLIEKGKYFNLVQVQNCAGGQREDSLDTREKSLETSSSNPPSSVGSEVDLASLDDFDATSETQNGSDAVLDLHDVHFTYPARPDNKIFRGLSLEVNKGETLAIVGPSGQGKSTILQLIEEYYRPTQGSIRYNGDDLVDLNVRWYRNEIALVSQEPTLFDGSIADNIKFGMREATQVQIEVAATKANAHKFISEFPEGYNTPVGTASSSQISGGQKQRIAIARALLRNPKVLLLDEATSALDSESEKTVQDALDKVMLDNELITIVIAHRLSTIRRANRIVYIDKGKVRESGSYEELMAKPNGLYKRLEALQSLDDECNRAEILHSKTVYNSLIQSTSAPAKKKREWNSNGMIKEKRTEEFDPELVKLCKQKAKMLARGELFMMVYGSIGALLEGFTYPGNGFAFALIVDTLYQVTLACEDSVNVPEGFETCKDYWDATANSMRDRSIEILKMLVTLIGLAILGNKMMFQGFGTATERINKRVRDMAFKALIRQEVAWYDVRAVGDIVSQLSDDTAMIHSFSGEPIRTFMMSFASVGVGLAVSFYFMWEVALATCAILPFLAFGVYMTSQQEIGSDEGDITKTATESSEGMIVVETLVNIRTIASLCMESKYLERYTRVLEDNNKKRTFVRNILGGLKHGVSSFFEMNGYALMFYVGSWCLQNRNYDTHEYWISVFGLMLSLPGLAAAISGLTDAEKAKAAAIRIFELIERTSEVDPLSEHGKIPS